MARSRECGRQPLAASLRAARAVQAAHCLREAALDLGLYALQAALELGARCVAQRALLPGDRASGGRCPAAAMQRQQTLGPASTASTASTAALNNGLSNPATPQAGQQPQAQRDGSLGRCHDGDWLGEKVDRIEVEFLVVCRGERDAPQWQWRRPALHGSGCCRVGTNSSTRAMRSA